MGKKREEYYKGLGWLVGKIEGREKGELRGEELVGRERNMQREERWRKIRESKFNKMYGRIKGAGIPEYLKKDWKEERWQRMARYILGEEMRGNKYLEREENRKCRVCWEGGTCLGGLCRLGG